MKIKILISLLSLGLVLTGCNSDLSDEKAGGGIKEVSTEEEKPKPIKNKPIPTNLDAAFKAFHAHNFGDMTEGSINIDKLTVRFTKEIFIIDIEGFKNDKSYRLTIGDDGKTLEEKVIKDNNKKSLALDLKNLYPPTKAMEKALAGQNEGARVKGYEIGIENGKAIYKVDLAEGKDVKINGATGEIIK